MHVRHAHAAIAILGILTLFSVGYWYIDQTHDGFRPLAPLPAKKLDPYAPRAVRVEESTEFATITGTYPQFDAASVALNREIQNVVRNAIEEHKNVSQVNWESHVETALEQTESTPPSDDRFPLSIRFEAPVSNERLVSVLLHISQYSGGAHGISSMYTFNYDMKSKRILTLADVFKNHPSYLKKLSEESRRQLTVTLSENAGDGQVPDADFLTSGTEPTENNFSLFTFTPQADALTIYFGLYQVAAYAYGEPYIVVPLPTNDSVPTWLQ